MNKTLLSVLAFSCFFVAQGQTTIQQVADLNTTPKDSDHNQPVEFNGKLYFSGRNSLNTEYLYSYDGVNPPTIAPGVVESSNGIGRNPGEMVVFNNKLYFNGYATWKGNELIEYDGVNAPKLAADIYSTGQSSSSPANFKVFNNKLYFSARSATGVELWVFDGTNAPTKVPTSTPITSPTQLTIYKNKLYFTAIDGQDEELFAYDGTNPIKKYNINEITTGNNFTISSKPKGLVIFNDTLYFGAKGTDGINELYKFSEGDSFQLARLYPGAKRHTYPTNLAVYNGKLYYSGVPRFGNYDLLEYDGQSDPKVVHKINGTFSSRPLLLKVVNNTLYFKAIRQTTGYELYKYNGVDTPVLITDMLKGTETSNPEFLTSFKNKLFYLATDSISGREFREYDGVNPPKLVSDFTPGTESSQPSSMVNFKGKMYFHATTGKYGKELWEYDGTNDPKMVDDYNVGYRSSIGAGSPPMLVYKNKLIYLAEKNSSSELVAYDGTNPPSPISTMYAQGFRTTITSLTVFKDNLYFDGFKFTGRRQLYKYDGDTILLVASINPNGDANPGSFFEFKDKLYFNASNGTDGGELWVYDGTNAPSMVADLNTSGNSYPNSFQELNGNLYFIANNGTDSKIFKYDGTNTPTEVSQGNLRAMQNLSKYKDKLYFYSWDGSQQPELYSYDGINAPTIVAEINPGSQGSQPRFFEVYHDKLYFSAYNPAIGYEIWSYDGKDTASFDHVKGATSFDPQNLHVFNNKLYFSGNLLSTGWELFSLEAPNNQTNVNHAHQSEPIQIYPNPTKGIIHIKTKQAIQEIKVYNALGNVILTTPKSTFSVAHLPQGLYVIQVSAGEHISSHQIIKYE